MRQVDLIVIGAGPGGYETAVKAAESGLLTVLIEARKVGGTCLNEGCIPTKCFCRNAALLNDLKEADVYGVEHTAYSFNIEKAVERKNQVVASLQAGIDGLLKHPNIIRVAGHAQFRDAHTVYVADALDGNGDRVEDTYTAPHIFIATGSESNYLPIEGAHLPGVYTSKEMLDITVVPKRLCVIGGGVIGLEFASIFNAFGSEVTVVEFCKEILPNFDGDIAKRLRLALKGKGITFITQAAVQRISQLADGQSYAVSYEQKGGTGEVETDLVLMAVGRRANVLSLNLDDVGIVYDKRGIVTNEYFETNIAGVYAIGDVNGKCQLAHAATFQGMRALNHLLGKKDQIRMNVIPAAVFTQPEAATVGLTETQCKEQHITYTVHKGFFRSNGKALAMNESEGMVKLIADDQRRLIGCHLFGPHAADLVQEVTVLMCKDGMLDDLQQIIHAHPTLGEVVMNASWA